MRHPNELPIAVGVLEQMMAEGGTRMLSVKPGPSPEARIIGVRWEVDRLVLLYDRRIEEPALTLQAGLEAEVIGLAKELDIAVEQTSYPCIAALLREKRPGGLPVWPVVDDDPEHHRPGRRTRWRG